MQYLYIVAVLAFSISDAHAQSSAATYSIHATSAGLTPTGQYISHSLRVNHKTGQVWSCSLVVEKGRPLEAPRGCVLVRQTPGASIDVKKGPFAVSVNPLKAVGVENDAIWMINEQTGSTYGCVDVPLICHEMNVKP